MLWSAAHRLRIRQRIILKLIDSENIELAVSSVYKESAHHVVLDPSLHSVTEQQLYFPTMSFLRFLMLLALIVWIGGIIFFAFVEAPTLFSVLPTTKLAGDVVSASLTKLHWMGLVSGLVFLIASLLYNWQKSVQLKPFMASHVFVVLMLILTAISQFGITPRMRELRVELLGANSEAPRVEFDRLHEWSTRLEGGVLLCGLLTVILTARRFGSSS